MIDQQRIQHLFDYDSNGLLIWKNPPTNRTQRGREAGSDKINGYRHIGIDGKVYLTHRLIYLWHHGFLPKYLDHINRIKSDNRIENLRDARGRNNANRTKSKNKLSQFKGVTWCRDKKIWRTTCKEKHVGYYHTEKAAAEAYNLRAIELFGEHAHLNIP